MVRESLRLRGWERRKAPARTGDKLNRETSKDNAVWRLLRTVPWQCIKSTLHNLFSQAFCTVQMPGENRRRPKSSQSFHELAQKLQYDIFISRSLAWLDLQQEALGR